MQRADEERFEEIYGSHVEPDIAAPSQKKLQFVVHDFADGFDTCTDVAGWVDGGALA
jgi:protease I